MGTVTARFQAGQIQWLIALEPAVEGLTRNPEMAAGEGHVLRAAIEIHPGQADLCRPAQLHPGRRQSRRPGWLSALRLHTDTLLKVSLIILNENMRASREMAEEPLSSQKKNGGLSPAVYPET